MTDDTDIPLEVRRELMRAATASGSLSYHWLCDIYRRGAAASAQAIQQLRKENEKLQEALMEERQA